MLSKAAHDRPDSAWEVYLAIETMIEYEDNYLISFHAERKPIEQKYNLPIKPNLDISRAQGSLTFPANFQLVAAMNPCLCGYYGDQLKACTCSSSTVTRYQKRISGPLLDRIDIHPGRL